VGQAADRSVGYMMKKAAVLGAVFAATAGFASVSSAAQPATPATHLVIWMVNSDGLSERVILTGAVGDYGAGQSTPDRSQTLLTLSRGTFKVSTAKIDSDFVHQDTRWPYDAATCSIHGSLTDPVPVIPGSGTGAYRGISGTFTMTITLDEDWRRQAGCNETTPFQAQLITIEGTGTITP
jgi:hypothetical protein